MKRQQLYRRLFLVLWTVGLGLISAVLLTTGGKGGAQHYVKLLVVGILWAILLLSFAGLRSLADVRILTARADQAVILAVLVILMILLVALCVSLIARLRLPAAGLVGVVVWGLGSAIRDLARRKRGRNKEGN